MGDLDRTAARYAMELYKQGTREPDVMIAAICPMPWRRLLTLCFANKTRSDDERQASTRSSGIMVCRRSYAPYRSVFSTRTAMVQACGKKVIWSLSIGTKPGSSISPADAQ